MTIKVQEIILDHAVDLIRPLRLAADSPETFNRLLGFIGWNTGVGLAPADILAAFEACKKTVEQMELLIENGIEDIPALVQGLLALRPGFTAIQSLAGKWKNPGDLPANVPQTFVDDLLFWLLDVYMAERMGRVQAVLELAGLITRTPHSGISLSDGTVVRQPMVRMRLDFTYAGRMLEDPVSLLRDRFVNGETGRRSADAVLDLLAPYLVKLLNQFGLDAFYGTPGASADPSLTDAQRALAARFLYLTYRFVPKDTPAAISCLDVIMSLVEIDGDFSLIVNPAGSLNVNTALGSLAFKLVSQGAIQPLLITRKGVCFQDDTTTPLVLDLMVSGPPNPKDIPLFRLGGEKGTRLAVSNMDFNLQANLQTSGVCVDCCLLTSVNLTISRSDGDGFLNKVLPATPMEVPIDDLDIRWSNRRGFYINCGAGLETTLTVNEDFGPVKIYSVYLASRAKDNSIEATVAATMSVKLGPITAAIEMIGLAALLSFPPKGDGNLGVADLSIGFKPPKGLALSVAASVVEGGGYLMFDPDKGEYAGALELHFNKKFIFTAFGILTTKIPDGSSGYSLFIIICATFPPIQIGFGFSLNGIGGLLGLNRTMQLDALRAGVVSGALESVMFPQDPIGNASQVVQILGNNFPSANARFLIAPMVKLAWGNFLRMELCVMLELPAPVRVAVVGRMSLALPNQDDAIVLINMDSIGTFLPDRGEVSIDATMYASNIAGFPITGDMALRATWKDQPCFAFSAGGFHPAFVPPAGFPKLKRLGITIAKDDNPRIRLDAYLAVTSNTVQFGSSADLYAHCGPFNIRGTMMFDSLICLDPFGIQVDLGGSVEVKAGNKSLCAMYLDAHLTGPHPWHAWGKVSFSVLFISAEVHFDAQIGHQSSSPKPLPNPVDVGKLLLQEIENIDNWSALPPDGISLVTLRSLGREKKYLLAHPLGGMNFTENRVPLGVTLQKFGPNPIAGASFFKIDGPDVTIESDAIGKEISISPLKDAFARAQFFDLSDAEKLSSPSFEYFNSGVSIDYDGIGFDDLAPDDLATLDYNLNILDNNESKPSIIRMDSMHMLQSVSTGPASRSRLRRPSFCSLTETPGAIEMKQRRYAVIDKTGARLKSALGEDTFFTFSEAAEQRAIATRIKHGERLYVLALQESI